MMQLYDLTCDLNSFASFLLKTRDSAAWGNGWFEGTIRGNSYPLVSGERNREESDVIRSEVLPDFTHFDLSPIPTFSAHAREVLDDLLTPHGEFAVIELNEPMRYFAFNATTMVDVLDEARSEIARFRSGGVMAVDKHVLLDSVTALPPIFKIPQTRRNTTYVNETFVERVQASGLKGFRFELLFER